MVCLLLVCLILTTTIIIPAQASAVLVEVLAVTARSMIASLIRACGVYVADGIESQLQDFESLTDDVLTYVWERLPDRLKVVNAAGSLMIKMVLLNNRHFVPRSVAELVCEALPANIGLDSSGSSGSTGQVDYATELGFLPRTVDDLNRFNEILNARTYKHDLSGFKYCYFINFVPLNPPALGYTGSVYESPLLLFINEKNVQISQDPYISTHFDFFIPAYTKSYHVSQMTDYDDDGSSKLYTDSVELLPSHSYAYNGVFFAQSYSYYIIEHQEPTDIPSAAYAGLSYEDDVATIASSWAAEGTTVTDDKLGSEAVPVLPVSVYGSSSAATASRADIVSGSRVEAETETVTDSVSDATTDATTETGFWSSVLSWLDKILQAIKALISGITTPIVNSLTQVISAIKAVPVAITDFFTLKFENLDFYTLDLTSFFPFCIPFDLYKMLAAFVAEPEAPVFTFATGFLGNYYEIDIDLSPWDSVAKTLRTIQLCICIVGLAYATRKFIKW